MRTESCSQAAIQGRLSKAREFLDAANDLMTLGVTSRAVIATNFVHAGIAAADVICCRKLGIYSSSANHQDARVLLERAEPTLVTALTALLAMKTEAGYGADPLSAKKLASAEKSARKLVAAAEAA